MQWSESSKASKKCADATVLMTRAYQPEIGRRSMRGDLFFGNDRSLDREFSLPRLVKRDASLSDNLSPKSATVATATWRHVVTTVFSAADAR